MSAVDLNALAEKLRQQRNVGVSRNGQLTPVDPQNNGLESSAKGNTTLEPKRFFVK